MGEPVADLAVVVPAHDEAALLGRCLDSLAAADRPPGVRVRTVVVLDACTDGSAGVARSAAAATGDVTVVRCTARCVGAARAVGAAAAVRGTPRRAGGAARSAATLWLAGTDADCVVPQDWLTHHVALADAGADLVLGLVDVPDDGPDDGPDDVLDDVPCDVPDGGTPRTATASTRDRWRAAYGHGVGTLAHGHVHGANLGVRADVLRRLGGWPALPAHEDRALVRAARAAGARIVTTTSARVLTSARLEGRAPQGVAADLARIEAGSAGPGAAGRRRVIPPG